MSNTQTVREHLEQFAGRSPGMAALCDVLDGADRLAKAAQLPWSDEREKTIATLVNQLSTSLMVFGEMVRAHKGARSGGGA